MSGMLLIFVGLATALGCGGTTKSTPATAQAGRAAADAGAGGATSVGSVGDGGVSSIAGAEIGGPAIELDASTCATRPTSMCENLPARFFYQSFDDVPGFEQCSALIPLDGCRRLFFGFDSRGCAVWVAPGAGEQPGQSLDEMRQCLTDAFARARFPCFASATFGFYESCFIR
jgi:hypothetical protein